MYRSMECGCVVDIEMKGYEQILDTVEIEYCPKHSVAIIEYAKLEEERNELVLALRAARAAVAYAIKYYAPSVSAEAEILSHINGYEGSPEVDKILEAYDE